MTTMEVTEVQTTPTLVDVRPLRAQLAGDIVTPEDEGWDEARLAWNLAIDQRPAAVALTESAADVAAVVALRGRATACGSRRRERATTRLRWRQRPARSRTRSS